MSDTQIILLASGIQSVAMLVGLVILIMAFRTLQSAFQQCMKSNNELIHAMVMKRSLEPTERSFSLAEALNKAAVRVSDHIRTEDHVAPSRPWPRNDRVEETAPAQWEPDACHACGCKTEIVGSRVGEHDCTHTVKCTACGETFEQVEKANV